MQAHRLQINGKSGLKPDFISKTNDPGRGIDFANMLTIFDRYIYAHLYVLGSYVKRAVN